MRSDTRVQLFPYVLTRSTSGSVEDLRKLSLQQTAKEIDRYLMLSDQLKDIQQSLSSDLYTFIAQLTDSAKKQSYIQLRRDIFNGRNVDAHGEIDEQFRDRVKEYITVINANRESFRQIEKKYHEEAEASEQVLLTHISQDFFQKALLLSSTSLYEKIKNIDRSHLKDKKFVRSLMKYLTRTHMKTTPYSTFVEIGMGNIEGKEERKYSRASVIRINNQILRYLLGLLYNNKALRKQFPIKLNPTIELSDTYFTYLTNNNNRESFQKITRNESLDLFYTTLVDSSMTYHEYSKLLITKGIKAPQEEIEEYIDQLLVYGFIEYALPVSGTDAYWDRSLLTFLQSLQQTEACEKLCNWLQKLHEELDAYAQSSVQEREHILSSLFISLRSVCRELHREAELPTEELESFEGIGKQEQPPEKKEEKKDEIFRHIYQTAFTITKEQIIYEDLRGECDRGMDEKQAQEIADALEQFTVLLSGFDGCDDERDRLLTFYRSRYREGEKVPLLQFYEEYFRDFKKPMLDREKEQKKEGEQHLHEVEAIQERVKRNAEWLDKVFSNVDINTDTMVIDNFGNVPDRESIWEGKPHSYGAFLQCGEDKNGKQVTVVESIPNGWGKMMSRFLHLFNQQVVAEQRKYNTDVSYEYEFVENIDASFFNANIHPPLMPFEVAIPSGHNNVNERERVKVKDLEVYHTESESYLGLYDKLKKKRVFIFDNGFQGLKGRSELFNLLDKFSIQEHASLQSFCSLVNKRYKKEQELWVKPRITIVNNIVLQRKTFVVPFHLLPLRNPAESDWEYMVRVNEWRQQYGIASEVFVKISSVEKDNKKEKNGDMASDKKQVRIKAGRDDYKPQYISFTNPYLVDLFERMCHKVSDVMEIQEILPYTSSGKVTERLIQWYRYEKS